MKLTTPFAALVAILCSNQARGQSALDGFDPNADGRIQVIAVQPNGKILIGGNFTTLTPNNVATFARGRIARLNPDGSVDASFNANANGIVRAIAVQADGKILIGGDFTLVNKTSRNHIARLDSSGALDSFDPNADNIVRAIAVQFNGQVVFGGDFTTLAPNGGSAIKRLHIARVNPSGLLDSTFALDVNNSVLAIASQGDNILVGGAFTSINSTTRNHVARVRFDGSLDTTFDPNANGTVQAITVTIDGTIFVGGNFSMLAPSAGQAAMRTAIVCLNKDGSIQTHFNANAVGSFVDAISIDAENRVLVGGEFASMGEQPRNRIARLNQVSGLADSFDPNVNGEVFSIAVQQDAKVLVGGFFGALSPNGGSAVTRNFIARLEIDGRLDQTLDPGFSSDTYSIALQPDGKILVGGIFFFPPATNFHLLRLNTDGTLDNSFSTTNDPGLGLPGGPNVYAIAVQADDGNILAGGDFTTVGGALIVRNHIVRLKPDGTLDTMFDPNANGDIHAIVVLANKQILIGGDFTSLAPNGGPSIPSSHIARLNKDGTVDPGFAPNVNNSVDTIAIQSSNNEILIGGPFTQINGGPRNHIALLKQNGLVDLGFDPKANDAVFTIAVQPSGNILVGGDFTSIGGQIHNYIAKVTPAGALDTSFNPNVFLFSSFGINSIGAQADGKILIGGFFEHVGGLVRDFIARLDPTNGLPDAFDPDASIANGTVSFLSTTIQADGKILVGGTFDRIGGQPRHGFARLSNDTAALQRLIVTPTTVTLTRGGSSPQFSRVTFEFSTDDVNFTSIGEGTSSGSNWILTGLNLPTGQNFIIRARGHYQGGLDNGSESVLGTRQNAFFPGNFVIGDRNAVVGQHVVFWGAQWAKSNSLSGGSAPTSFKGFANETIPASATCGGTWSSGSGNTAEPPTGLPETINVVVASSITQSGSTISGDVFEMAVVRPDPGYDANPGHAGTGTVISVGCDGP